MTGADHPLPQGELTEAQLAGGGGYRISDFFTPAMRLGTMGRSELCGPLAAMGRLPIFLRGSH